MKFSPKTIASHMKEHVVGQDKAVDKLANMLFLHYSKCCFFMENDKVIPRSNIMVTGPSGSGKTFMIEKGAEFLGLPVIKVNAKEMSNTGYVGNSIQNLISKAHATAPKATRDYTIVFIDEIDKIIVSEGGSEKNWYLNLQYSLLKVLEGDELVPPPGGTGGGQTIDISKMMFVLSGNFQDMRDIEVPKPSIGFAGEVEVEAEEKPVEVIQERLMRFGMVKELVGRIGNVVEINELTLKDFSTIIKTSKSSAYTHYMALLKYLGKDWKLSNYQINKLAEKAMALNIGARALNVVLDDHLQKMVSELSMDSTMEEILEKPIGSKLNGPASNGPTIYELDWNRKYLPGKISVVKPAPAKKDKEPTDDDK